MSETPRLAEEASLLVSFDIDGTLEVGHPPGPVTLELVRRLKQGGHRVGSSSDRTLGEQRTMWQTNEIEIDFVSHKHHLDTVRSQFDCVRFVHIGDTITDWQYAEVAGFEFRYAADLPLLNPEVAILGKTDHESVYQASRPFRA